MGHAKSQSMNNIKTLFCLLIASASASIPLSGRTAIGFYEGPGSDGTAKVPALTHWFGRLPDRGIDFLANDSWPSLESDTAWTAYSWSPPASGAVLPAMTFSVPLTVNGTSLADVAAGLHDHSFIAVAQSLVAYHWSNSVIRIGWEFNGGWMPWAAGQNPTAYVAAYRHVVAVMRSVPGADFTFDWCTSWGPNATAPDSVYPGDDVVDIIGMDVYDRYYSAADANPVHRWNTYLTAQYGLNWLVSFSKQHGKPISIPEWGTGESYVGDGGMGGGDDPVFVANMSQFMSTNSAVYSDYWDISASGYNATVSDGEHPLSGAALKAAFSSAVAAVSPPAPAAPTVPPPGPILWIGVGDAATLTTVSINFAPPGSGGLPSYYVILDRVTGQTAWNQYSKVTWTGWQTVSGLKQGTSYDFEVYAANAGGNGGVSAVLTLTTTGTFVPPVKAPGSIPWIGVGQAATATTISINFAPPNDGGTPAFYMIQYRVNGWGTWQNFGKVTWTGWQTVGGLQPGTTYDFQVYASNASGTGAPSAILTESTLAY
jgi:Fibronectin type III domain/Glycosyl hydrolase family 26